MKRLNPDTNEPFKQGNVREDGYIFFAYKKKIINKNGFFKECWRNPEKFAAQSAAAKLKQKVYASTYRRTFRGHINMFLKGAKNRAKEKNLLIDIDLEYLIEIAPKTCPVFGTEFEWGKPGKHNSSSSHTPALDRIVPELGYVKGNVQFLSCLANLMKSNATPAELLKFAEWIIKNNGVK